MIESILIALVICIDSFALGIAYGIKKITIPRLAVLIITLVTMSTLGLSILLGHMTRRLITGFAASLISSLILISIGFFFMLEGYIQHLTATKVTDETKYKLANFHIPKLKIIVDIAFDVTKADLDVSGDINFKEALYIGSILSIDSICAGFGYSIGNANTLYFFIFVFVINIISISCGLALGGKVEYPKRNLKASLLPGIILITIGILKWIY